LVKSTAGTISYVTDNSANWDTAYSWGDHSLAGYLTSFTETDPVFAASDAAGITAVDISQWDTAYSWGDHSLAGYLTAETDPIFAASEAATITSTDIANWDSAYSWGDHAAAGYVKGVFVTASTGASDSGKWTKIATITLSAQSENSGAFIAYHNTTNGQGDTRAGFFLLRSKQENALGFDPFVEVRSYFLDETSVDIGYVIVQNTPTSIVDIYIQPNNTFTQIYGTAISIDNDDKIVWYSNNLYEATTPVGLIEVATTEIVKEAPTDGLQYVRRNGAWEEVTTIYTANSSLTGARTVDLNGNELIFDNAGTSIYLNNGRIGAGDINPWFSGSQITNDPAYDIHTGGLATYALALKQDGDTQADGNAPVVFFTTLVGGGTSDGYTTSIKNFKDDVQVISISGVGAADITDSLREVETTFGLRNDYTGGQFSVFDTFNNDYPSGTAPEVRQAQGWVAIHGGGATAKEIGLWRYDTTTYTQIWSLDVSNNWIFENVTSLLSENSYIGAKRTGGSADGYRTMIGNSGTTNNFLVGGSTTDSPNSMDVYLRIRTVAGGDLKFHEAGNSHTVWHEGNDGAGSGLDADLVHGRTATTSGNRWDVTTYVSSGGVMEVGQYIDFHQSDTDISDYGGRLQNTSETLRWQSGAAVSPTIESYFSSTAFSRLVANASGGALTLADVGGTATIIRGYGNSDFYGGDIRVYNNNGVKAQFFNVIGDNSTSNANNWDTDFGSTAPSYSFWTTSNTTSSTNYPTSFGQTFWVKGAGDTRSFSFWKASSANNPDLFYLGVLDGSSSWVWNKILNEGTHTATVDVGSDALSWTLKSQNDVTLKLHADYDNFDETHNPLFVMSQDGDIVGVDYGIEGNSGTAMTGTAANDTYWRNFRTSENMHWGGGASVKMTLDCGTGDLTANDFVLSSDERLKKDIRDVDPSDKKVRWRQFKLRDSDKDELKAGVVAQELQEVYPQFVRTKSDGHLSVAYTSLFAAELAKKDKQIEDLQGQIDELRGLIKAIVPSMN
jgi:hypothetical protein